MPPAPAASTGWPLPSAPSAAIAAVGVLLSLLAGVSRTALAMARNRELPPVLDAVHPRHHVPHRAQLAIAALVIVAVLVGDLRGAIGFSSFTVLTYYAIANASAWTLTEGERRWPRPLAAVGVIGCIALALTLPVAAALTGAAVLTAGALIWRAALRPHAPRDHS